MSSDDEEATVKLCTQPKTQPDAKDREIAAMWERGWNQTRIANYYGDSWASINRRLLWMRAERWMVGTRLLTTDQRRRLLQRDREFCEVEEIPFLASGK